MPFTFAHPAIILPLKQAKPRLFSLTGLVAGSMAPDFEYFFKVHATSTVSETIPGIFTFNLPVAIGISFLFHLLVRNPLILHLPSPYDKRLSGFLKFDFLRSVKHHPFRFLISAFIGVVSHLLLDLITSPETMTRAFHKLQQMQFSELSEGIPALNASLGSQSFLILERAFSIFGLILIGYLLTKVNCPAKNFISPSTQQKTKFYTVFAVLLAAGVLAAVLLLPYGTEFAQMIITFISAGLLSLTITSLLFYKDGQFAKKRWS